MTDRTKLPPFSQRIEDRILGAKIVNVEELADGNVRLEFEHRGTDMDAGHLVVMPGQIEFDQEDE